MTGDRVVEHGADSRDGRTADDGTDAETSTGSDRGVTVTLNYILVLSITAVLVSGVLVAGGAFFQGQRPRGIAGRVNVPGDPTRRGGAPDVPVGWGGGGAGPRAAGEQ